MGDLNRRIERIERHVGAADCICATNQSALLVIDDDFTEEQQRSAEACMSFVCPTHGVQSPKSTVRISSVDAHL